jgi:hypothetical protein
MGAAPSAPVFYFVAAAPPVAPPKADPPPPIVNCPPPKTGAPCTPGKICITNLQDDLTNITEEVGSLKATIAASYNKFISAEAGTNNDTYYTGKIKDFDEKRAMYDRLFQENEAVAQRKGGRTRKQTLQEYVILFFYISYFMLAIGFAFYKVTISGSSVFMSLGIMLALLIPITVILLQFL